MIIKLKDGSVKEYSAPVTAAEITKDISMGLYRNACCVSINGKIADLRTVVEGDCDFEVLTFDDEDGKKAFNHTASHVMAQAVKRLYPNAKLTIGPAIENGFYYDFDVDTHFTQDEDTLDTWFSSALWPFSTLGWPDKTEDLDYFYPTNVLVTGYDIIFFWVIRMVFSGIEHTGKLPFHTVLFHGLVRDSQGRKMSKSLGNGIDPLEVIDQYGADALRLTLITGNAPGNDMRFYWERVEASRNFANKIWNASRFVLMNQKEELPEQMDPESLTAADRWILSKVNTLAKEATDLLDRYELGIAADMIQSFIWEEFCDWYIEMVKTRLYAEPCEDRTAAMWTLTTVLANALKLLHPYMPFLTEELYSYIRPEEETIMRAEWPVYREDWNFPAETEEVDAMKEAIRGIRNVRTQMNVSPKQKTTVIFVSDDEHTKEIFTSGAAHKATAFIPLEQLVDLDKERARLAKERERLDKEIDRLAKKLNNPGFVSKAPAAVVEEERKKQARYEAQRQQVEEQLARLG